MSNEYILRYQEQFCFDGCFTNPLSTRGPLDLGSGQPPPMILLLSPQYLWFGGTISSSRSVRGC